MTQVTDVNIVKNIPLPAPSRLAAEIPRTEPQAEFIATARKELHEIIFDDSQRFLVVLGPCSIHDPVAGLDYAKRLTALAAKVSDRMMLVMRVYFEKPRTSVGWKGLIMDPHLDGSDDIPAGLALARRFLRDVADLGMPTATELLDPITPQYIADLICWSAIGARTTESQTHRQMASGLSMPLGFKNATSGAVVPAINAIKAATQPQTFLGVSADGVASAVSTRGNPNCHVILRGGDNGPNFSSEHIASTKAALVKAGLRPAIMVDCSHSNCGKDPTRQPEIFMNVLNQFVGGETAIIGTMLESNLAGGSQAYPQPKDKLTYGCSITDPCLSWEATEKLILEAHAKLGEATWAKL